MKQLDVRSPQGEIEFAGRVREREIYTGDGHGSFRWTVGERSYAGVLDTRTQGSDATLTLKLTAPLDLDLQAQVTQSSQRGPGASRSKRRASIRARSCCRIPLSRASPPR